MRIGIGSAGRRILAAATLALALVIAACPAQATIHYQVGLARHAEHRVQVDMSIPGVRGSVTVQMAAWDGLYQIRDFAHQVAQFRASDTTGKELPVVRLDKQTWRIEGSGEVRVQYAAFWDESGPFGTQLDAEHAFLNLGMVLCYVPGRLSEDVVVRYDNVPQGWRVAVQLPRAGGADGGATTYSAPNYDALVDAPVEIGRFEEVQFRAGGRPIRAVVHGDAVDRTRLISTLTAIVDYQTGMMGEAPFSEYLFLFHVGRRFGGGGMEHSNSTAVAADNGAALASVSAHEFFHLWNVKRIRPQSLEPVDRTREMWTRALWFAEGVTNTYASYTLVRTGLWSKAEFLADLDEQITSLQSRTARSWQSVEESSLTAWFEKYSLYNRPEFSINYYNKGQLLGLGLDLVIRDATDNRASLDDVLRKLNQQYAHQGRFYSDSDGVRSTAEEVIREANRGARTDLAGFFRRFVAGSDELPLAEWLAVAGLTLRVSGERREVAEMRQPTERQRRILDGLLKGSVSASAQAASNRSGGR